MKIHFKKAIGLTVLTAALVAAMMPSMPAGAAGVGGKPYGFTPIDYPSANVTVAYGINAGGDVVGSYILPNSNLNHGFLLRDGKYSEIEYPGDDVAWSAATAISPAGDIVGIYSLKSPAPAGNVHGFLRTNKGEWSTVDYPIGDHIMQGGLYGILPDGTMLGCFHDGYPTMTAMRGYMVGPKGTTAFDYPSDQPFAMHYGATPDGRTIVGIYRTGTLPAVHTHGYLIEEGEVTSIDFPNSTRTQAFAINSAGVVVGEYDLDGGPAIFNHSHGFVVETRGLAPEEWKYTTIDVPDATATVVRGINAGSDLVGNYIDASGKWHGFLASRTQPRYRFTTINYPSANITIVNGINSGGAVVGNYVLPNSKQNHGFILTNGKYSTIEYPGGVSSTIAQGISPAGDIVGSYGLNGTTHGFLMTKQGKWSTIDYPYGIHTMQGGLMRILPDGTMVGCYHDGAPAATSMWGYVVSRDGAISSSGYPDSAPYSMHYGATPDGKTFVGMYRTGQVPQTTLHGYLLSEGKLTSIDVPGATMTQALDISAAGEAVGVYTDATGKTHGFSVETRGSAAEDWQFTTIDFPGATSTIVRGINAGGDLVGNYVAGGITRGFLASRTSK